MTEQLPPLQNQEQPSFDDVVAQSKTVWCVGDVVHSTDKFSHHLIREVNINADGNAEYSVTTYANNEDALKEAHTLRTNKLAQQSAEKDAEILAAQHAVDGAFSQTDPILVEKTNNDENTTSSEPDPQLEMQRTLAIEREEAMIAEAQREILARESLAAAEKQIQLNAQRRAERAVALASSNEASANTERIRLQIEANKLAQDIAREQSELIAALVGPRQKPAATFTAEEQAFIDSAPERKAAGEEQARKLRQTYAEEQALKLATPPTAAERAINLEKSEKVVDRKTLFEEIWKIALADGEVSIISLQKFFQIRANQLLQEDKKGHKRDLFLEIANGEYTGYLEQALADLSLKPHKSHGHKQAGTEILTKRLSLNGAESYRYGSSFLRKFHLQNKRREWVTVPEPTQDTTLADYQSRIDKNMEISSTDIANVVRHLVSKLGTGNVSKAIKDHKLGAGKLGGMLDELQKRGVISTYDSNSGRKLLMKKSELDDFIQNLNILNVPPLRLGSTPVTPPDSKKPRPTQPPPSPNQPVDPMQTSFNRSAATNDLSQEEASYIRRLANEKALLNTGTSIDSLGYKDMDPGERALAILQASEDERLRQEQRLNPGTQPKIDREYGDYVELIKGTIAGKTIIRMPITPTERTNASMLGIKINQDGTLYFI